MKRSLEKNMTVEEYAKSHCTKLSLLARQWRFEASIASLVTEERVCSESNETLTVD
jgi:hypothetical protein